MLHIGQDPSVNPASNIVLFCCHHPLANKGFAGSSLFFHSTVDSSTDMSARQSRGLRRPPQANDINQGGCEDSPRQQTGCFPAVLLDNLRPYPNRWRCCNLKSDFGCEFSAHRSTRKPDRRRLPVEEGIPVHRPQGKLSL
jgi:hypothetical protein